MALELTQPLIEISTSNLPGDDARLAHETDKVAAIWEPTL
jgi:hypothetical protein